jgi:peroxiredoxin Q/BCP
VTGGAIVADLVDLNSVLVGHAGMPLRLRPKAGPNAQIDPLKATKGRRMTKVPVEGSKAPAFTLSGSGGSMISLSDFDGRKLVLYFYPKADTPGCTQEAIDFSQLRAAFEKVGASIVGVSADPVRALDRFQTKHDLSVALGSDESHAMLEAYGVWGQKSMFGKKYMGVNRMTFLIGPDGRIAKIWPKVKVSGHAKEVLEAAKAL